ncbi:transcriptional regulator [Enterococcus phage vB_Efs6_KEN16]|uniref:Transcriptional regulator n=1 Tax=Enterococcus phage vB_Efs6_KEN16 TaxID=3138325 RepID=A0AAX4PTG6_9CAUD
MEEKAPKPKVLKRVREARGESLRELANMIGVHWSSISYWENGIKEPRVKNRVKLAKLYNIPVEILFEEDNGQELPL